MGLFRTWKRIKATAAAGTSDGHAPQGASEIMTGLMGSYLRLLGPVIASQGAVRGRALPGSETDLMEAQRAGDLASGVAAVRERDGAFDPARLTSLAERIFALVTEAWSSGDTYSVRPWVSNEIWEPLAAASNTPMGAGLGQVLSKEQGQATLVALAAGEWYDSALFRFDVSLERASSGRHGANHASSPSRWNEQWLVQRSTHPGGNPEGLPDRCPRCGAPTDMGDDNRCLHCAEPVPVLTSGWLLTCVHADHSILEDLRSQISDQASQNPDGLRGVPPVLVDRMPPELLNRLPADVVADFVEGRSSKPDVTWRE